MLSEKLMDAFYARLKDDIAEFAYRKRNGELRIARGTTSMDIIPEESKPKGTGTTSADVKPYWDLNSGGWRAFDPAQVVWIRGIGTDCLTEAEQVAIQKYKAE